MKQKRQAEADQRPAGIVTIADPFKLVWYSIKDLFDEMFLLIGANVVFVLMNLPLMGLAVFFFGGGAPIPAAGAFLLGMLVFGPSSMGLYSIVQRVTEGRVAKISLFFSSFREYLMISWRVYLPWGAILILLLVNLSFYSTISNMLGTFLIITFLYLVIIWTALLIYLGPLLLLQEDRRLRLLFRNALLMTLGRPVFTLLTFVLMAIIFLLSFWLLLVPFLITFSLLAIWSYRATIRLVKDAEARQMLRAAKEAAAASAEGGVNYSSEKGRGGQIRPRD